MKRVESESVNFSCTHQCLIFRELIATHAEHSPIFQNWRCSVSEYTDHNRYHWYMTQHHCRPQFVFKTKKGPKETFEERYIWLVKTYFWVKDVINPVLAQLHFPGACKEPCASKQKKSFVPQLKSTICFHFKGTNIKCEGWGLITVMRFPTKMISIPANKGFCRPKSGCTVCSDFFQCWLGFGLGLMRICEDWDRAVPTHGYFHFVISRCSLLLPSIMILNRQQHQGLFWAVPTRWTTELQGGSDNGAYQSSCIVARLIFPGF